MEKKTIQEWREEYLNDFLPSKKHMLEQINAQDKKIMKGLIKAIREAIPEGKLKTFFEKHLDYSLPWEKGSDKNEGAKGSLYRMLNDRMPRGVGICLFNVEKEEILEAGFASWDDFIKSLKDLNEALGNICVFKYLELSQKVSVDTTNIKLMFDTTLG
jgi:hypothetical protein